MPAQRVKRAEDREPSYPVLLTEEHHVVDDGGHEVIEAVVTDETILDLYESGILNVGNPRPDHDHIPLKSGAIRYRKTPMRLEEWAEQLCRNEAILGNLTWNLDPDEAEVEIDTSTGRITLLAGSVDTPDSATRHRAIVEAANASPRTMKSTRFAVRIWFADDDEAKRIFHFYNQVGKPVDKTVAKFNFQASPEQELAKNLMLGSRHLGVANVETKSNRVSANSPKLCAFNTLSQAFEDFWTGQPVDDDALSLQTKFVVDYWASLVAVLPDLGIVSLARRKELRPDRSTGRGGSLVDKAVAIHGFVGLASELFARNSKGWTRDGLRAMLAPLADMELWSYENPDWLRKGVLVQSVNKDGKERLSLRNARQSRAAVRDTLVDLILAPGTEHAQ